ncbi:MAG TPA: methyltransferase domain-containing protein [Phycisphaerae bacterium]|nr:methyltransferase domain-containing protein [Phycisphaerae bacterium]
MFTNWLRHPATADLEPDDPRTTELRRQIIRDKPFLRKIYQEWYQAIAEELPQGAGEVLEIGSGAGFMGEFIPGLITSDVMPLAGVSLVIDGARLPFDDGALKAVVMTDVLHHIRDVRGFLREAQRCLRPGGAVVMVEPWNTPFSRLIYRRLHTEPFRPEADTWELPPGGPLSGANGALPWILFERDREQFRGELPLLRVDSIRPFMPFRYLLSGGVGFRGIMPDWTYRFWLRVEQALSRWMDHLAMFARIKLVKSERRCP